MNDRRIVVVGGGLAGSRVVAELRERGHAGELVLVCAEQHLPYDRPPLSKAVIRGEIEDTTFKPHEFYTDLKVELRLGVAATGLDTASKTLELSDGTTTPYDDLIIATGLDPRWLPGLEDKPGVHALRTIDDARALRADAVSAKRAVIVGAGFVGCELAASFRSMGIEVTLVEPQPTPLAAILGEEIGSLVGRLHVSEGVDLRAGVGLISVTGDERATGVTLTDGTEVSADVVVLGIGSRPVTGWLEGSGIELGNGIVTDAAGRTSADGVWAIGDVAHWDAAAGGHRVEHWTNVVEQVATLVTALLGADASTAAAGVRYFWSDQFGLKIQSLGTPSADCDVTVEFDDGRKFLAWYARDGRLVAVVGAGQAGKVMSMRAKIAAGVEVASLRTVATQS